MDKSKIPTDGPLLAANIQKAMNSGLRQRYAVSIAGLQEPKAKSGK